jgi:hypothetical protein
VARGLVGLGTPRRLEGQNILLASGAIHERQLIVGRSSDIIGPAELAIYATWDEMRANVPKRIFESAEKAAGLRVDPVYPEEPLEV